MAAKTRWRGAVVVVCHIAGVTITCETCLVVEIKHVSHKGVQEAGPFWGPNFKFAATAMRKFGNFGDKHLQIHRTPSTLKYIHDKYWHAHTHASTNTQARLHAPALSGISSIYIM